MSHEWSGWLAHRKWALVPALLENVRSGAHATTHAISYVGLKSKSYGSAPRSFEAWRRGAKAGENQDGDEVPDQVCYDTGMMDSRWTSAQSRSARRRGQCAPWISSSMRRGRREVAGGPWERVVPDRSADPALHFWHMFWSYSPLVSAISVHFCILARF